MPGCARCSQMGAGRPGMSRMGIYIFNFPTAICCGCPEGETTIHWGQKSQIYSSQTKGLRIAQAFRFADECNARFYIRMGAPGLAFETWESYDRRRPSSPP